MIWNYKQNNNSGVILIVVLWILVILSVLAIGLGRKSKIDLALIKYSIGSLNAKYLAQAGIKYAMAQIHKDNSNGEMKKIDTLYQCGIVLENDESTKSIFKHIELDGGYFDISYRSSKILQEGEGESVFFGIIDEERKININAISKKNSSVIKHLIILLGFEESLADTIAASLVDWHDQDSQETNAPLGAEDDYYQRLAEPYHCKNAAFDHISELLLIRGVTQEIYEKMKNYITVFPKDTQTLLVNINTASKVVIQALARNFSGGRTNTELEDADNLAEKIIMHRMGDDLQVMSEDDRLVILNDMALNARERVIFLAMQKNIVNFSNYLRIRSTAVDERSGVQSRIEAVVFREDFSIMEWKRE
ncbi:hypothetical protein MNBD_UNCLBAC01-980 [hydrothermal vent metagenome]|uniref:T2SS protein K first SAM-like domain-containing protein n=1 Tax=hydrothermal vent metagenome TaxID=652676 RepID=A0A3B1D5X4_9ZZZZ